MAKTRIRLPGNLMEHLDRLARQQGVEVDEFTTMTLSRALDTAWQRMTRTALSASGGQRDEARIDPRLDWWRQARFGMFIHWGLYALPAGRWNGHAVPGIGEWIMKHALIGVDEYERLAADFNPVQFDADAWVRLAAEAGQKYLVITAKHHDGFSMFATEQTDYNIVDATPFGRDPMAELAEACRKYGIKFGFYYSQTQDWHHPDGDGNYWDFDEDAKAFDHYVQSYVKPQVRELLTQYGDICLIWFDTPRRMTVAQSRDLLDYVHAIQPECLVSGRVGNTLGDYASTGDNAIPDVAIDIDWETPATINDTWGFKTDDHNWKSSQDLIAKLADIVSKGGNYLLNVGPTAEGLIPDESADRLRTMGDWLREHGESIYGSRPGPLQGIPGLRSTQRAGRTYLHLVQWPEGGILRVNVEAVGPVRSARLLHDGPLGHVPCSQDGDMLVLDLLAEQTDEVVPVVVLNGEDDEHGLGEASGTAVT
jgi:alpha-L-fucosidase